MVTYYIISCISSLVVFIISLVAISKHNNNSWLLTGGGNYIIFGFGVGITDIVVVLIDLQRHYFLFDSGSGYGLYASIDISVAIR